MKIIEKALAQGATKINTIQDVQTLLQYIVGWAQIFFYILATLFIILGAWDYLRSDGEAEKVKKAKERMIYSLVAIGIAVVAGGVVTMVRKFIG